MNARETILKTIRRHKPERGSRKPDFSIPLPVPDFGPGQPQDPVELFSYRLSQVHATCETVGDWNQVPDAVSRYLADTRQPAQVVASPDDCFYPLDWGGIAVEYRAAVASDQVSVTRACAGIAETGTIAMVSSPASPVTLNFLPETHIVVLEQTRLVASMEQFWLIPKFRPRAINFITGPSKTADIEQTIVYGAHGPRRFHVLLILDGWCRAMRIPNS